MEEAEERAVDDVRFEIEFFHLEEREFRGLREEIGKLFGDAGFAHYFGDRGLEKQDQLRRCFFAEEIGGGGVGALKEFLRIGDGDLPNGIDEDVFGEWGRGFGGAVHAENEVFEFAVESGDAEALFDFADWFRE